MILAIDTSTSALSVALAPAPVHKRPIGGLLTEATGGAGTAPVHNRPIGGLLTEATGGAGTAPVHNRPIGGLWTDSWSGEVDPAGLRGRSRIDPRGHSEHLAPLIAALLADAGAAPRDLSAVIVGTGPGPFTGLRVGIVTGLTMAYAVDVPVFGLCSLDALAAASGMPPGTEVLVASDARRKEVYWARYRVGEPVHGDGEPPALALSHVERLDGPHVDRPADLPEEVRALPTVGRGPLLYPDLFPHPVPGILDVDARALLITALARHAAGTDLPVEPLYLRRPDALTSAERAAR